MSALTIKYESLFFDMIYSGKSIRHILNEASVILDNPVRFSPDNRIEEAICSPNYPIEDILEIKKLLAETGPLSVFLDVSKQENPDAPFISRGTDIVRIFCNVMMGSRYFGNITIPALRSPADAVDLDFVSMLSKIVAVACCIHGQYGRELTAASLLRDILSGSIASAGELHSYPNAEAPFSRGPWMLAVSDTPKKKEPVIIESAMKKAFTESPVVQVAEHVAMIFSNDTNRSALTKALERIADTYTCTILLSHSFTDIFEARNVFLYLLRLPEMAGKITGYFSYAQKYDAYLLYLSGLEKEQGLTLLCADLLAVMEHDAKNDTQYMDTICAYLSSSYQVQAASELLHTHKNTVLYRMSRIQELFGLDLKDNRCLYHVNLALRALRYWNVYADEFGVI